MVTTGNLQDDVIAGSVTVGVASVIAVLLRFKARRLRTASLAIDDYSTIVAVVIRLLLTVRAVLILRIGSILGHCDWKYHRSVDHQHVVSVAEIYAATHYGLGRHIQTLTPTEIVTFMKVVSLPCRFSASTNQLRSSLHPKSCGQSPLPLPSSRS